MDDEIPKILPFTKFNIKNILGDFEMDPLGNPILDKDAKGHPVDRQGRRVNAKGYLIDADGNLIDKHGKVMFAKGLLDADGDIPKVYRTGLLKSDTASSLSRLMDEIERNQPSDFEDDEPAVDAHRRRRRGGKRCRGDGDTSVESGMDDTPANYNAANQRHDTGPIGEGDDGDEDDEEDGYGSEGTNMGATGYDGPGMDLAKVRRKKKKPKKKKRKKRPEEYEDPSLREHLMAGAYGGVAKPKVRRAGVKYTTDLDSGLRDLAMPAAHLPRDGSAAKVDTRSLTNILADQNVKRYLKGSGASDMGSAAGAGSRVGKRGAEATSKLLDPQQREAQLKNQRLEEIRRKKIKQAKRLREKGVIGGDKDADFAKLFGQDIDQFLENSEFDIDSDAMSMRSGASRGSKASGRSSLQSSRLRSLEKNYLQRIEGG